MLTVQLAIETAEIYTCAFAPDGTRALIGSQGNPVGLWDVASGRLLREYEHAGPVWALAWSGDERCFLSLDGTMRLWEVDTGRCVRAFDGDHARCVAWSADQQQVLSASNGTLTLTNFQSGRPVRKLEGHADGVYCAAFDLKGRRALSGSRDRTVRVWDLQTGHCLGVLKGHTYHVHDVVWAADQRHAISCSRDIRLWNVDSGECLRVFEGHAITSVIRSVAGSADQGLLLSAAHDRTVRLWDPTTGKALHVFRGHPVGVVAAAFSRDRRRAFSCDWNGGIGVWDLTTAKVQ
jgi:WD40 repeat protein